MNQPQPRADKILGKNIIDCILNGAMLTIWLEYPGVHASLDWDSEEIFGRAKAVGATIDEAIRNLEEAAHPTS